MKCLKTFACVFVFLFAKTYSQSPVSSQTFMSDDESLFLPYTTTAFDASDYYGSGDDSVFSSVVTTTSFTIQPSSMTSYSGSSNSLLFPSEIPATLTPMVTVSTTTPTSQFTTHHTSSPISPSMSQFSRMSSTSTSTSTIAAAQTTTDCSVPSITNGVHVGRTTDGSEVSILCNDGFVNTGVETITCINGHWSNDTSCSAAQDDWPFITGLAVGIPLFVLFCVALCCCCWYICVARKRRRLRRRPSDDNSSEESVFVYSVIPTRYFAIGSRWPTYCSWYPEEPRQERRAWPSAESWTYAESVVSDAKSADTVDDSKIHVPFGFQESRKKH